MRMVQEATDQTLIDLATHVGFEFEAIALGRLEPSFWRDGLFRLFVSHLAKYKKFAGELQAALLDFGISAFVAHSDIEPTQEWQLQIETALATCEALVALLHEGFHESIWTDQEIGFVMGRGLPAFAIKFGHDPYGFIGRFQAFDGARKTAGWLANELFEALKKNKQTRESMSASLVTLFEDSATFAEARARLGWLEELEVWSPAFTERIRSAARSNSQISEAWGVPDRIRVLAKKWRSRS